MPVNSLHPLYEERIDDWTLLRDCLGGERQMKASADRYIPMLDKQTRREYQAFVQRGMFYAASDRTVTGLTGVILRKPYELHWPDSRMDDLNRVGVRGESFDQVVSKSLEEVLGVGRIGWLVDAIGGDGARARVSSYHAEHIINWYDAEIDGEMQPVMVVLRENSHEIDIDDGFKREPKERYRVLRLGVPAPPNEKVDLDAYYQALGTSLEELSSSLTDAAQGVYYVDRWVRVEGDKGAEDEFVYEGTVVPRTVGGRFLTRIPFVAINDGDCELTPTKPPLLDLATVNVSHFRNSVDLEHGLHFTALPTPYAFGVDVQGGELAIGSSQAWLGEAGGSAGYVEFTGAGLRAIESNMEKKERLMAVLGARLLEEQRAGVETAEALRLRQSGDQSVLATVAANVGQGLSRVLRLVSEWMYGDPDDEIGVELNADFASGPMDARLLATLVSSLQGGAISYPAFFHQLERGELLPDGWTIEDEVGALADGPPGQPREETTEDEPDEVDDDGDPDDDEAPEES